MGFFVVLESTVGEVKNADLVWYRGNDPVLHLEHENEINLQRVREKELVQLRDSPARSVIGLFYCSKEDLNTWIEAIKDEMDSFREKKDMLFIINPREHSNDIKSRKKYKLYGQINEGKEWEVLRENIFRPKRPAGYQE